MEQVVVALTGGGTAGHVVPHLALLPEFVKKGWKVIYIGSNGVEERLITQIPYFRIQSGKLRRYFSIENVRDVFKVLIGFVQALLILRRERPQLLFSKGGFVSVPVAWAAFFLRIPVLSHESDVTPGLANRMINPIAKKILYCFKESEPFLRRKGEWVGLPIRASLASGSRDLGLKACGFALEGLPVLLVMGGSLGAQRINEALKDAWPLLKGRVRVIHITGRGKDIGLHEEGYRSFEFVGEELCHLFAASDIVLSRAGATTLFELLALKKPMILVPLEAGSRGDQITNALAFQNQGWARSIREAELKPERLLKEVTEALQDPKREQWKKAMASAPNGFEATGRTVLIIESYLKASLA